MAKERASSHVVLSTSTLSEPSLSELVSLALAELVSIFNLELIQGSLLMACLSVLLQESIFSKQKIARLS